MTTLDPSIRPICVCGNHDIGNTPTTETIEQYTKEFGSDYFSFWIGGCKFISVNSQFYQDDSATVDLHAKMDEWLDAELLLPSTSVANQKMLSASENAGARPRTPTRQPKWQHLIGFQVCVIHSFYLNYFSTLHHFCVIATKQPKVYLATIDGVSILGTKPFDSHIWIDSRARA
jgi:hypothetical protein